MKEEWQARIACAAAYVCLGGTAAMITLAVIAKWQKEPGELFQSILQRSICAGKWFSAIGGPMSVIFPASCACSFCGWSWAKYVKILRKRMAENGWMHAMKGAGVAILSGVALALGTWMLFQAARDLVWCLSLI